MKIVKIVIENFKGICEPREIILSNFSVIVGQNDAGKSTILKAIDHFLNDTKPNIDDSNHNVDGDDIRVSVFFDPRNYSVVIDGASETTLEEEGFVNEEGLLEITKIWDVSKSRVSSDTYVKRISYEEDDFVLCSEKQLIDLCTKYGIETRKGNDQEFNNVEKRRKLRNCFQENGVGVSYEEEKLPTRGTGRLKELNDALNKVLPRFEYFKADTSLSESDTSIQNFFRKLSEKIIREEVNTDEIEEKVGGIVDDILKRVTKKINDVVGDDESVEPEVKFDWTKLIQTSFKSKNGERNIPLSSRGDGFRRITMMAYFEYLAEQHAEEKQNIIFGFEEPETFLHPSAQEKLFSKLKALCNNDYSVIISTHSAILVSNSNKDNLIHVCQGDGKYLVKQNIENVKEIADDLGITVDNQFVRLFEKAKLVFLVEGIDDAKIFHHLSDIYKAQEVIESSFRDLGVVIIPMGSCGSVKHWVSLDLVNELERPFFVFVDSDKKQRDMVSPNYTMLIGEGLTEGVDFLVSKKREIENYIPHSYFLRERADKGMPTYGDWDDVKELAKLRVGGKNVARIHFPNLEYDDLRETFFDGDEDEFIKIYSIIKSKL